MHSPAAPDLEAALERAVARQAGEAPNDAHLRWHFGFGEDARRGKRLRSRLVLAVAEAEGAPAGTALDAAVAVELVHEFSLIHDDIEDGDRLRRGRETLWARFGVAHGINAGDTLCAAAYLTLLERGGDPALALAMTRTLMQAQLAMCAGQAHDIAFESASYVGMDAYRSMIAGKTAALFGAACALGGLAAGLDGARVEAYAALGRAYGIAFQIEDDILGAWGEVAQTGKPSGADLAKRKWSFPVVWALAGPPSADRERIASAYAAGTPLDPAAVEAVSAALLRLGAREAAAAAARTALAEAEAAVAAQGIDGDGRVRAFLSRAIGRAA